MLTESIKSEIRQHAESESPRECCGLILSDGSIYHCRNVSDEPMTFSLHPRDYLRASLKGEIKAYYHSHINEADLGLLDSINIKHGFPCVIYSLKNQDFKVFNESKTPYADRHFKIGISDCYTLVQDYFREKLEIILPNFSRDDKWFVKTPNLIQESFAKHGFEEVEDYQQHDLLVVKSEDRNNAPCHFLIYLGNGKVLHHPRNSNPLVDNLENYSEEIAFHLRYAY